MYISYYVYLVIEYSRSPECKFSASNVPMQPRSLKSRPIFQVTKRGLKKNTPKFMKSSAKLVAISKLWLHGFLVSISNDFVSMVIKCCCKQRAGQSLTKRHWRNLVLEVARSCAGASRARRSRRNTSQCWPHVRKVFHFSGHCRPLHFGWSFAFSYHSSLTTSFLATTNTRHSSSAQLYVFRLSSAPQRTATATAKIFFGTAAERQTNQTN